MGVEIGLIAVIVFDVIRLLNNCYVTNSVYTCNYMIHMLIQVSNNFILDDEHLSIQPLLHSASSLISTMTLLRVSLYLLSEWL